MSSCRSAGKVLFPSAATAERKCIEDCRRNAAGPTSFVALTAVRRSAKPMSDPRPSACTLMLRRARMAGLPRGTCGEM